MNKEYIKKKKGLMKKYQIIYADPPWSYYDDTATQQGYTAITGMGHPSYPVMSSKEIMNLPIKNISDKNCILFIWTTDHHLEKCLKVIKSWGFEYKAIGFVWLKKNKQKKPVYFESPYTMKSDMELCLLAIKGKFAYKLVKRHNIKSLIESVGKKHSGKPAEVKNRIVKLLGDLPRIELFARQKTKGWDAVSWNDWDNEVKSYIKLLK